MKKITIIKFFTFDYSFQIWDETGMLDREVKIYQELEKLYNVSYVFISFGNKDEMKYEELFINSKIIPVYSVIKYSKIKFIRILKSLIFPFILKNKLTEFDLIKQNQLYGSWIAILLKILSRKPLYLRTGYDMYQFSKFNSSAYKRLLYYLLTQISLIYADFYTVTSLCDKKFLNRKFFKAKYIELRPNWVNKKKYNPFENRYNNKLVSVGRLEGQKNYKYLLNEIKDLNFEIDIFGHGSQKEELLELANKFNIKINLLGTESNNVLIEQLSKYKYFISTSTFEGNPKAVLEALSVGCIVFASNIENNLEIITDNNNGFLFELENGSLNKTLKERLNNKNLEAISKKGYEYVNKFNSFEKSLEAEINDYKDLIDFK